MLEKVLIGIISRTSRFIAVLCIISITGPFILGIITAGKAFQIYRDYSNIFGDYGVLKIIGILILCLIIDGAIDDVRQKL